MVKSILMLIYIFCLNNSIYAQQIVDKGSINSTEIAEYTTINSEHYIEQLRKIILQAKQKHLSISLRGIGHSGGGQSYNKGGIILDLANLHAIKFLKPNIIRVQAGCTWKEVLEFLNPHNLSVTIMQSDYDFTVGGTISTNVHGWQMAKPPIISSIIGFNILTADGKILYCNRNQNSELFKTTIGGYGLLGIIIDVDLSVTDNKIYKLKQWVIDSSNFKELFNTSIVADADAELLFGRFSLHKGEFLKKLVLKTYINQHSIFEPTNLKTLGSFVQKAVNLLFNYTYGNQCVLKLRWYLETNSFVNKLFKKLKRNQLLYHSVNLYYTTDPEKIDLLQEYFVPLEKFNEFVSYLQTLEQELSPALLNLTLRYVKADTESILNYAPQNRVCLVMYFRGAKTTEFSDHIKNLSLKITDKILKINGTYYLPYNLFQSKDEFIKAYPNWQKFKAIKEKYDPSTLFINEFYKKYFE